MKLKKILLSISLFAIGFFISTFIKKIIYSLDFLGSDIADLIYYIFLVIVIVCIAFFSILVNITIEEVDSEELNKKYEEIKNSVIPENSISEKNNDILELMFANMREINDYYILSKTQAKKAFNLAVFMCLAGILLMAISILAAFFQSSNVISAVIPAVGAAIVEVIAGTSLIVYKNSLSQLNRYFNSLHSNERFLSIVNIVSKASPEVQDDMYFEIIKSQIGVVSTDVVEDKNEESKVK